MFLWRAASANNWLFDRDDFTPLIDSEANLRSLRLMVQTHAKYATNHRTPGEIFSAIKEGELAAAIGFPQRRVGLNAELYVENPPGISEASRVLLDPFSPVISLSANCRQSAVAKTFLDWLSSSDGGDTVRTQVAWMTDVRRSDSGENRGTTNSEQANSYDPWLARRLSTPLTLPTLQVLRSGYYYRSLDQQILRALAGDVTPKQALREVAQQWKATTGELPLKEQLRAWRRAQGMRA
jgi:hypothetical protein